MAERPKRRKYKDNPYTLECIEERKIYSVSFKDVKGKKHKIEVNQKVFEAFDRFELDNLSEMNEYDNHIEHSEIYENNLNERAMDKPIGVDEIVEINIMNEELKNAVDSLADIQKRRIKMYFFEDMTLKEIAEKENCAIMSVKDSIDVGIRKLKEKLKKFKN